MLPFIANFDKKNFKNNDLEDFQLKFFSSFKISITSSAVKNECAAMTSAYFECLKYMFKKFAGNKITEKQATFYLNEFVIELIQWSLTTNTAFSTYIFLNTSAMITYFTDCQKSGFYSDLLNFFWCDLLNTFTKKVQDDELSDGYVSSAAKFINQLYLSNYNLLNDYEKYYKSKGVKNSKPDCVQRNIKRLSVLLVRSLIQRIEHTKSITWLTTIREITNNFHDLNFYSSISKENTITETLNIFTKFVDGTLFEPSDIAFDIIFEILSLLETDQRVDFVNSKLSAVSISFDATCLY